MFESLEKSSASRCQLSGKSEAKNTNFETDIKYIYFQYICFQCIYFQLIFNIYICKYFTLATLFPVFLKNLESFVHPYGIGSRGFKPPKLLSGFRVLDIFTELLTRSFRLLLGSDCQMPN